jgi:hypothetical protein
LLAAEIAGKIPAHVQSTALPVMEDIDELNDFTFSNGGRSLVSILKNCWVDISNDRLKLYFIHKNGPSVHSHR